MKKEESMRASMEEVAKIFMHYDTNRDGKISVSELKNIVAALGSQPSSAELSNMMAEIDTNNDGFIDLKEFSDFYLNQSSVEDRAKALREAFDIYDKDNNGLISASELHTVMNSLGQKVSLSDCKKMIKEVDKDGDGHVNFQEFQDLFKEP